MPRDPDVTPELTEVLSGGNMSRKAFELEDDLAQRMTDGARGLADAELGDAGPYEDDHPEALPADIRTDHIERQELSSAEEDDLTREEPPVDPARVDGDWRGAGSADLQDRRQGGERAAAVADETQYRPRGPVTAARHARKGHP